MKPLSPKHPILIFLIVLFVSCQENGKQQRVVLMQDIQDWILPEYSLKSRHIRNEIEQLTQEEPKMYADAFTKKYYAGRGHFVWITRHGVGDNADTLLSYLNKVDEEGLKPSSFFVSNIENDLHKLRNKE